MPLIKSAKKKLRKDIKITAHNKAKKENIKQLLKTARRSKDPKNMPAVFSALDKAVKTKYIHTNKAARLKSRLSALIAGATAK